jgi:hypothetical protein
MAKIKIDVEKISQIKLSEKKKNVVKTEEEMKNENGKNGNTNGKIKEIKKEENGKKKDESLDDLLTDEGKDFLGNFSETELNFQTNFSSSNLILSSGQKLEQLNNNDKNLDSFSSSSKKDEDKNENQAEHENPYTSRALYEESVKKDAESRIDQPRFTMQNVHQVEQTFAQNIPDFRRAAIPKQEFVSQEPSYQLEKLEDRGVLPFENTANADLKYKSRIKRV